MVSVRNLTLSFGKRTLFEEVNLSFSEGNCYGIIGANGAGKTTFLKVLIGEMEASKGTIEITKGQRMSVLQQNQNAFDEHSVINTVMLGNKKMFEVMVERDAIYAKEDFTEADGMRAGELEGEFGEMGGYTAESDAGVLLKEMGLPDEYHSMQMADVPANLKVKILLAQALFGNPDILVMDEPTNNLDLATIGWLENFLADYQNIVLVVSHDRHFLDAVCTHVADVDKGKINIHTGNYSFWYESSQLVSRQQNDKNKKTEDKRKELLEFIARFSANASKSKQATSRKKALEKLNVEEIVSSSRRYPGIFFKPLREPGNQVLEIEKLGFEVDGKKVFNNITLQINKTDKIGIVSRDKRAVTGFMEIINGVEPNYTGSFSWGTTISKAYLPNEHDPFFAEKNTNLLDWLRNYVPPHITDADEPFIRGFYGRMLFGGDDINKKVGVLSGGEKVRCLTSRMMLQDPNCIILDEPTAHLDLESIQSFNEGVVNFNGIVFISSQDHTFMHSVCNRIIELTPNGAIDRLATFDEYLEDTRVKELQEELYV